MVDVIVSLDGIALGIHLFVLVRVEVEIVKTVAQMLVFLPEWSGDVNLRLLCILERL